MAKSVLDIVIRMSKEGGADKDTVRGLVDVKNNVTSVIGTFAAFAGVAVVVDQAYKATVGTLVDYADQVRNVQFVTGASAEESSRMIQVADDAKISYEALAKAMQFASKQGITPNIEGLAQLSDKYLTLQEGQERENFLLKEFGKNGGQMAELMRLGGDAIRQQSAAIDQHLVLTQKEVDEARQYQAELDELNDRFTALKITVGEQVLPVVNQLLQNYIDQADAMDKATVATGRTDQRSRIYLGTMIAQREAMLDGAEAVAAHADALQNDTAAAESNTLTMEEQAEAAKELTNHYKGLIGSMQDMQSETNRYAQIQQEANDAIWQANQDLSNGKITIKEHDQILEENNKKLADNAKAHQQWAAQTVFSFLQARAAADGNISQAEGEILIQSGEALGLWDDQTAQAMESANRAFDSLNTDNAQDVVDALEKALSDLTGITWEFHYTVKNDGGGGGGGGCFVAGTLITMADDSQKPIERVQRGDRVLSYDAESGRFVEAVIEETFVHGPEPRALVVIDETLTATPEHLIWADGHYRAAIQLHLGLNLMEVSGGCRALAKLERVLCTEPVYNLHTGHRSHNYFANGILVHNLKSATGADFIVPPGYPDDTYPLNVESGEHVVVTPRDRVPFEGAGGPAVMNNRRIIFTAPVTFIVQNGQTVSDLLEELR